MNEEREEASRSPRAHGQVLDPRRNILTAAETIRRLCRHHSGTFPIDWLEIDIAPVVYLFPHPSLVVTTPSLTTLRVPTTRSCPPAPSWRVYWGGGAGGVLS